LRLAETAESALDGQVGDARIGHCKPLITNRLESFDPWIL